MFHRLELPRTWWVDIRRHRQWRHAGVSVVILGIVVMVAGYMAGGRELYLIALLLSAWCAVSAWRRADQSSSAHRAGWFGIAIASALAGAGQAWWLVTPPSGEAAFVESPGHLGMVGAMVIFLFAAVRFRPPRRESADSVLLLLDLVIVTSTLVAASWSLIVSPSSDGRFAFSGREAIATVHAGAGGLLLFALFVIGLRLPASGGQRSIALLAAGLASVALADLGWMVAWVNADPKWIERSAALPAAAFTLLAIALGRERRRFDADVVRDDGDPGAEAAWRLWLLYPPVLLLSLIVGEAAISSRNQTTDPVVILGSLIVIALVLVRQGVAIRDARRITVHLRHLADRDPLTNLLNHRTLHERLDRELEGGRRGGYPVAVALIDVDRFKQINDQLGHVVGDHVLRAIAGALTRSCRGSDIASRYAGDEFALILPGLDDTSVAIVGDRLLDEVAALAYWPGPDAENPVSISIGFAISRGARLSGRQMIAAADDALYRAKHAGRNRFAAIDADTIEHEEDPTVDPRRLITIHPAG